MAAKHNNILKTSRLLSAVILSSLGVSMPISALAAGEATSRERVQWDKLSIEQQQALKAASPSEKSTPALLTSSYVYIDGVRKNITVSGGGALATIRIEGQGTALRHTGSMIVRARTPKTLTEMNTLLQPYGITATRPQATDGSVWLAQSRPGLEGLQVLNALQESGQVQSATPDWQRDLHKK